MPNDDAGPVTVTRLDHVYVTVSDLARSERFYDAAMRALGFRKGTRPIGGEPHVHYFNRALQYTIRPARAAGAADAYRTGALHHVCFQVADAAAVDAAQRALRAAGVQATEPTLHPEYRPDYYATFFTDPDGIRLEVVADTAHRRLVRARWHELTDFEDPVTRLQERDASTGTARAAPELLRGHLFEGAEPPPEGERFETLAALPGATVERITSSAAPDGAPYDQAHDEWVLLAKGRARLEVAGEIIDLAAGDYVLLRAHTPHRVLETSAGAVWLAIHVHAP